jgi:hypothetical protein
MPRYRLEVAELQSHSQRIAHQHLCHTFVWGTCGPRSRSRSGHAGRRVSWTADPPTREPTVFHQTGLGDACPVWFTIRILPINLRYLSTSFLWRQAVVGMIGANRATRGALIRGARGDAARAGQTSTIPPSAACSARCASAGASLQGSTAAPEALHRSGPRARSGTTRWRAREATTPSPHHAIGCAAHPPRLFLPPGHGLAPRDTRRNS